VRSDAEELQFHLQVPALALAWTALGVDILFAHWTTLLISKFSVAGALVLTMFGLLSLVSHVLVSFLYFLG
jgi:hypothetical protein